MHIIRRLFVKETWDRVWYYAKFKSIYEDKRKTIPQDDYLPIAINILIVISVLTK